MSSQAASLAALPSVLGDDGSAGGGDAPPLNRSDPNRWYFPKEMLDTTPSRKTGVDPDKELTYRQQCANFIQDIGQRLQVNQLCINTAIVYMHRFYMFHSFTQFHRNAISAASIFLAAKVEEQPRKLEHVIKVAHYCLHRDHQPQMDSKSEQYLEQSAELVMNENILLQTLGFDVAIDHPHTHVVKCCQLVRASKDLAQTSYFMATNSLHLTTMCLQYKPTVVACVCIHLACKWSSWEIPRSKEGKDWFSYVDDMVTTDLLEKLTTDFLQIFNKSPSRLKKKIISLTAATSSSLSLSSGPYHGLDSSPGHHHQSKSRSPSPKRQGAPKPTSSQGGVPGKPKPHGMPVPHHPMKVPYPPGAPGAASKHPSHGSSHQPHSHPPSHSSSGKPPHPGMPSANMKDPHPHHPQQHPNKPYPPHGHGQHPSHGQYPHSGRPSSGSSQSHHGHGMHSKPPAPGSTASSSHPYSSTSMKNMQTHNPSKPPHMPPSGTGASKFPPNQVPGAVKNPSQAMFHSSQSHLKKPYEGRPEFKREGQNSGNVHHLQNHSRAHDKVMSKDGRHHPGLPPPQNSTAHHGMPYMGQDLDRPGSNSTSNQKMPYLDSRSMESGSDGNRHRPIQPSDAKRNMPHGTSAATNGNNNDNIGSLDTGGGSGSGAGDSHVPSKNAYRAPPGAGQNSQPDVGANKYHADSFEREFGYGNASLLSIEDRRRKRQFAETSSGNNSGSNKRPRTDTYAAPSVPSLSFSPEESAESSKRLPPPTSQFSPSAVEGTHTSGSYSKAPERPLMGTGTTNTYGGASSEGIVFGSSDTKPDLRKINPSMEFQAPELLQPILDTPLKIDPLPLSGNAPRAASLFSPEFTPTTSVTPNISISPLLATPTDSHKRDYFSNTKLENTDQQSSSGYSEGGSGSQVSFTGRLSNSPKREETKDAEDSHSSKKSKKSKKEKHKHKHKEEKKHKKDKHKDKEKEKEKDKKDKHRSKDKHSTNSSPPEVTNDNDAPSHKIKIKLGGRDDSKSSSVQSTSRHSSSKTSSSTTSVNAPLPALKVKISSKTRVSSLDEDVKNGPSDRHGSGSPGDESTPCCPGFGPCLTCKPEPSQDKYRFFSSEPAQGQGLTLKLAKNRETSKSSKDSSSRDSKKSKDKASKLQGGNSNTMPVLHSNSLPAAAFPNLRNNILPGNHHLHKNGMEKSSKKK